MIIDSHCHIHATELFPESREGVYSRAIRANTQMIVVGTSEADSLEAVKFATTHDGVWAVVGVHPHDTKLGWQGIEQLIKAKPATLVGIGEIGLDYFYDNSPRDVQIRALEQQLQWAVDFKLPVSFHVREAYEDFWAVYDNFSGVRGVLHCFTDTPETLDRALGKGLYIGVNGISTFTKDTAQQQMFASIPLERMLLETDAPFLTPRPLRGTINEPVNVVEVARHQAEVKHLPLDDILSMTTANTRTLFAL